MAKILIFKEESKIPETDSFWRKFKHQWTFNTPLQETEPVEVYNITIVILW
jgi:hypothetical protein